MNVLQLRTDYSEFSAMWKYSATIWTRYIMPAQITAIDTKQYPGIPKICPTYEQYVMSTGMHIMWIKTWYCTTSFFYRRGDAVKKTIVEDYTSVARLDLPKWFLRKSGRSKAVKEKSMVTKGREWRPVPSSYCSLRRRYRQRRNSLLRHDRSNVGYIFNRLTIPQLTVAALTRLHIFYLPGQFRAGILHCGMVQFCYISSD